LDTINEFVDFKSLNDFARRELSPNDQETWDGLYQNYEDQENKLDNVDQLNTFLNLFVKIRPKGYTTWLDYEFVDFETLYSYSVLDIEINSEFYRALYLNKFIHYSFE